MNFMSLQPHRTPSEMAYSKLAMLALCAIGLIAAIAKQQPAVAAEGKTATISLADIDLSTPAGIAAAHDRLHAAARQLCSRVVDPWALSHQPDYVRCVDETLTGALAQLPGPARVANANSRVAESGNP